MPAPDPRRGRILYSILALLLGVGVAPLVWTSWQLVARSRETVESNQKEWQLDKGRLISTQIAIYVDSLRKQVASIARTFAMGTAGGGDLRRPHRPHPRRTARSRPTSATRRRTSCSSASST